MPAACALSTISITSNARGGSLSRRLLLDSAGKSSAESKQVFG
jgi:hypothetical protein